MHARNFRFVGGVSIALSCCGLGCQQSAPPPPAARTEVVAPSSDSDGLKAGDERSIAGVALCWCPAGRFTMGSPRGEPERRPGENQVAVTLTRGFWMAKYEATQGQWKRVVGKLPGELTAAGGEGDQRARG